jgi:hypothetical protein
MSERITMPSELVYTDADPGSPQEFTIRDNSTPNGFWMLTAPANTLTTAQIIQLKLLESISASVHEMADLLARTTADAGWDGESGEKRAWRTDQ